MVPRPKHLERPPPQGRPLPKGGPALGPPTAAANSAAERAKEVIARLLAAAGASSGEGEEEPGASASASASPSAVAHAAEQREAVSAFRRLDREAAMAAGAAAAVAAALGDPAGAAGAGAAGAEGSGAGLTDARARSEVCLALNFFVQRTGSPGSNDAADARRERANAEAPELLERMVPCLPLQDADGHRGAVFAVFYLVKDSDADLRRLRAVPGVLDALRALEGETEKNEAEKIANLIEWLEAIPATLTKRAIS